MYSRLQQLTCSPEFDEAIVDAGAVPPLVALVRDGTPDAQEDGARALLNLAEFSDGLRSAIARAGGIPPLTVLARDGTAVAREDAAQLLQLISRDSELDDDSDEVGGGDARMADVAAGGATPAATAGCVAEFSEDFSAAAAAAAGK